MLQKLSLTLSPKLALTLADAMQGVLMMQIDPSYATYLHTQKINSYSQYISFQNGETFWNIQTTTEEAGREIISPLLSSVFATFHLKRINKDVQITQKKHTQITNNDFLNMFYFEPSKQIFRVKFITPTAFKSDGNYIFHPDLRLLFQSLMNKYGETNEDVLASLVSNSKIIRYNLKSSYASIERVRIPAFVGTIAIKFAQADQLANYARLLLNFGEYSGVGIKSSMGMGGMEVIS